MPNVKCCVCAKYIKPNKRHTKNPCWKQGCEKESAHNCCGGCEMRIRRANYQPTDNEQSSSDATMTR